MLRYFRRFHRRFFSILLQVRAGEFYPERPLGKTTTFVVFPHHLKQPATSLPFHTCLHGSVYPFVMKGFSSCVLRFPLIKQTLVASRMYHTISEEQ